MSAFAHIISPKSKDLGDGFTVRRALPSIEARSVGPFIFLDEMGPVAFAPGQGLDVRPHPHIGLATVTYLFEGAIEHRDSLGTVKVIRPGDVNWMTAGRGIVHSERSPTPREAARLHGIQFWVALPAAAEEAAPAFHHTPASALPMWEEASVVTRLIIGALDGRASPVQTFGPMLYADLQLAPGGRFALPADVEECALYVVSGGVAVEGARLDAGQLGVVTPGQAGALTAAEESRAILFGGAALDGPRKLWWNFVSTRPERIEQAKAAWAAQAMGQVPGETSFIPAPA
jgi:redox-sensitive bicupin YhaK (pirin superfamily)